MGRDDLQMLADMRSFALDLCRGPDVGRLASGLVAELIEPRVGELQPIDLWVKMADMGPCHSSCEL